jgi:hypothetical protein
MTNFTSSTSISSCKGKFFVTGEREIKKFGLVYNIKWENCLTKWTDTWALNENLS